MDRAVSFSLYQKSDIGFAVQRVNECREILSLREWRLIFYVAVGIIREQDIYELIQNDALIIWMPFRYQNQRENRVIHPVYWRWLALDNTWEHLVLWDCKSKLIDFQKWVLSGKNFLMRADNNWGVTGWAVQQYLKGGFLRLTKSLERNKELIRDAAGEEQYLLANVVSQMNVDDVYSL